MTTKKERKIFEQNFHDSQYKEFCNIYKKIHSSPEVQRTIRLITSNIEKKDMVVLDAGCGCGFYTSKVVGYCAHTIGLDISKRSLPHSKSNYDFIIADAEFLPFRNNTFGLVFCVALLHHLKGESVETMYNFLNDANRVLQKNGIFFVAKEPNGLNIAMQFRFLLRSLFRSFRVRFFALFVSQHEKLVTSWELSRAMEMAFYDVKTFYYQFFPVSITRKFRKLMPIQRILEKMPLFNLFCLSVSLRGRKK